MATDLSYINAAATRTGSDAITSLTEGTAVADVANQNYENIVKAELSSHRWKWATKFEALNLLAEDAPEPWLYIYQMPTDVLEIRTVTVSGLVIPYAIIFNKIVCNSDENSDVTALYVWRVPESYWPRWFAEAITKRMEAVLLRAIGERFAEAADRDKEADRAFAQARRLDSQSDTARDPWNYGILAARRG